MAEKIRKLANSEVEVLSRIVAECMTGSQMNEIFRECGVRDTSNESRFISGQNGNYDEILLEINKPLMLIGLQMTNEPKILTLKYNQ